MTAYRIDSETVEGVAIAVVTLSGAASFETIAGLLGELEALAPKRVLIDESGLRPGLVNPANIQEIARLWKKAVAIRAARIGVIAPSPVIYGLNRMFQSWASAEGQVAVFRGRADAIAWLVGG